MFELAPYLADRKSCVERVLVDRLRDLGVRVPAKLLEAMRYSLTAGGKRLRPILCLAFAESVRGRAMVEDRVLQDAACALEWVHTFSLVHDDLPAMDDDELRRGLPTAHKVYGEAMAILAGDALLADAFTVLLSGPEPTRPLLGRELAHATGAAGMIGGQVLDIAEDRPAEEGYLVRLHRMKTGALIRASCRMGVLAANGTERQLEAAGAYGDGIGLAFQIADDILDATSDAATLGKPAGADAAAGRHTFPAVVGLEKSRELAKARVEQAVRAVAELEPQPGPLAALARMTVERRA